MPWTGKAVAALLVAAGCIELARPADARGQDADPASARLVEAGKAFDRQVARASEVVVESFNRAEADARAIPNVQRVKQVRAARLAFSRTGEVPDWCVTDEYTGQIGRAKATLAEAYNVEIRDLLKLDRIDEAEQLEAERDARVEDLRPRTPQEIDARGIDPGPRNGFGVTRFGGEETIRETRVRVGNPQVTLIWEGNADLDLHVVEPGGGEISWQQPRGVDGSVLDADARQGGGVENVYRPLEATGPPPPGPYRWFVACERASEVAGTPSPARWKVRVKVDGKVTVHEGTLDAVGATSPAMTFATKTP